MCDVIEIVLEHDFGEVTLDDSGCIDDLNMYIFFLYDHIQINNDIYIIMNVRFS